jgi:hypothetical protein
MAVSVYFNNVVFAPERRLIEDLCVECIKINGVDVYYIPRQTVNEDQLLTEDPLNKFTKQYLIEMYVKSVNGFEGQGDILSKFGVEMRDSFNLVVARRRFAEEVGAGEHTVRPMEGDLIYFPSGTDLFEVKFVEHESTFYQVGGLYVWELRCERYEYSSEVISTGLDIIDSIATEETFDSTVYNLTTADGDPLTTSSGVTITKAGFDLHTQVTAAMNNVIQIEGDPVIDTSNTNPYVGRI